MTERKPQIYTAFGSPAAAAEFTGGKVYAAKGHEGDAFILTDPDGNSFVYVKPEYKGYRVLANQIAGERISRTGDDADHAASRTIAYERGGRYVLLARVPSAANRSASSVEKLHTLDGNFNYAAAKRTADGDIGLTMTHRQGQKLLGRKVKDYDDSPISAEEAFRDPDMRRALLQSPEEQRRMNEIKGDLVATWDARKAEVPAVEPVASGVRLSVWDKHKEPKTKGPPPPPSPNRSK